MIVICTKCQAKFRVADEKIGPRGAKVRCSRCQTVFQVAPGIAPAVSGGPPERPTPPPRGLDVELESPFGAAGAEGAAADPFAAAGLGAAPVPPPLPSPSDPFAAAASAHVDPFAPPPDGAARPAEEQLPVTDLAQLLGAAGQGEVPAPPDAEPSEPPGLALEDRITPPPLPAARPPLDPGAGLLPVTSADAYAMGRDPQEFGSYELGAQDEPSLALASDAAVPSGIPAAEPAAAPAAEPASAPVPPPAARAPETARAAPPAEERLSAHRGSRLRALVANAIGLAVLLAIALALLVVWRSEGPLDPSSLRPSAILAALRRGGPGGPFAAAEIRSGAYEREKGPPVVFVRGKVVSRAPAAVRGVKVLVEVVRTGGVVARGEALAGAVPTPEELYRAGDGPALAALAQAVAARAPREIRPGEAVPFLVAIADPPADLEGTSVRVLLAAAGDSGP